MRLNVDKRDFMMITKEFKLGDLVLVYTLKQLQSKLSKASQGPFVILGVSYSGAIRLSTLDGKEMPNWISGCCVKIYYTPLTTQELEHLQKFKWRQEKCRLIFPCGKCKGRSKGTSKKTKKWRCGSL